MDQLPRALLSKDIRSSTEEELAIRDSFDQRLGRLERFEVFINAGLITFGDLKPYLKYWMVLIGDAHFGRKPKETIYQLWDYINDYGFAGVKSLAARFGYDLVRPAREVSSPRIAP